MNNNVVITIFDVESEAFQAFSDLLKNPRGGGYAVPEAVLIKNKNGAIEVCDGFGADAPGSGSATGIVIGALVGILGGPIGVILGATAGGLVGSASDTDRAVDAASVVAVVADKLYEGEIAIAALVQETEPAFDNAFANYKTTIIRYDAADIADEVERLKELQDEVSNQVMQEIKADKKAARKERREKRRAEIEDQLSEYNAAAYTTVQSIQDVVPE